jgi:hypothetical protein
MLPVGLLDVIDRARRHCLWRRKDKEKVNSLAAWDMVCRPKSKGGLGIINLKLQNVALLLKHLHKFYNDFDTPWVKLIKDSYYHESVPHAVIASGSFWWRGFFSLVDVYRTITRCQVGDGRSILLWSDLSSHTLLKDQFPRLFSYAKDQLLSVHEFHNLENILEGFHLPISVEAHSELHQLQGVLQNLAIYPDNKDSWIFNLGKGIFRPNLAYNLNFKNIDDHLPSCWIWKSKCTSKHKFFAWTVLHDRINTKDMLLQRHWNVTQNHNCVLCSAHILEDWRHLFLIVFSAQESGTTCKFLGILVPLMNRWLDHESTSMDLVFLKWLFWLVGAFGNSAMVIFSKEFGQVSEDGKRCSCTK